MDKTKGKESKQNVDEPTGGQAPSSNKNDDTPKSGENASKQTTGKKPKGESDIDFKAELEKERALREKAEKKIVHLKTKKKDETEEDNTSPDVIVEKVKEVIDSRFQEFQQQTLKQKYDQEISRVVGSGDEEALVRHHLNHSIKATGDPRVDVANAKALANKKKLETTIKEVKKAQKAGGETTGIEAPGYVDPDEGQEGKNVQLTDRQIEIAKKCGNDPAKVYN